MKRSTAILIILVGLIFQTPALAQENLSVDELRRMIEENSSKLEALQKEREGIEAKLKEVEGLSNTLTQELARINYHINDLEISIKSNRLTIEKLGLEVETLRRNILSIEKDIKNTKETIGKLLVELQQKDNENLLVILLKNSSLSESVSEIQSIVTLGNNLTANVNQLRGLQGELTRTAAEIENKKHQQEIEQKALVNRQNIVEEQKQEKQYLLAQTKSQGKIYEQRIAELDEKQVEISRIIERFEDELRASFDPNLLPRERPGVLDWPVQDVLLTQCYGKTDFAQRAYRSKSHTGVDFRASVGTPILAAEGGTVVAIDNNDQGTARWLRYQYGKYVVIEHDNNLATLYAHLSNWTVNKGERVEKGDLIGYSGATGYITGPHLHFGVYWAPSIQYKKIPPAAGLVPIGVTIDPAKYLPNGSNIANCR